MNKEVTVLIYEFMSIVCCDSCYPQFSAVSPVIFYSQINQSVDRKTFV